MATMTLPDGKKRHVCDHKCNRICDKCAKSYIVHGMWRWGVQTFLEPCSGVGGLVCDECAALLSQMLHGGELSKTREED